MHFHLCLSLRLYLHLLLCMDGTSICELHVSCIFYIPAKHSPYALTKYIPFAYPQLFQALSLRTRLYLTRSAFRVVPLKCSKSQRTVTGRRFHQYQWAKISASASFSFSYSFYISAFHFANRVATYAMLHVGMPGGSGKWEGEWSGQRFPAGAGRSGVDSSAFATQRIIFIVCRHKKTATTTAELRLLKIESKMLKGSPRGVGARAGSVRAFVF